MARHYITTIPSNVPLPPLNPDQQLQLRVTTERIAEAIDAADGRLPFDRFMEMALYAPGAGYYVNGTRKFGAAGDFVTAPEMSPLFSQCLARQCAEVLDQLGDGNVLEFGAGSGVMAADILLQLERLRRLPQTYLILELSPDLQARQRETLAQRAPHLLPRVEWLDSLPAPGWRGVALGNELLDAMPVHRFRRTAEGFEELYVVAEGEAFGGHWGAPSDDLAGALEALELRVGRLSPGYSSEINLRLPGWMRSVSAFLSAGAVVLVDYGYSGGEFYHPERDCGTLICHFRHRAHDNPLILTGLQDITANVDFSAVAHAALDTGLELAGYTTQAHFLFNTGLQSLFAESDPAGVEAHLDRVQQIKQLTLPSEMGERFKVIALQRGLAMPLQGFSAGDLRVYL